MKNKSSLRSCSSKPINPFPAFQPIDAFHIKKSFVLLCKQMAGFYMKCNTGLKWVKRLIGSERKRLNHHQLLVCFVKGKGKNNFLKEKRVLVYYNG